MLGSQPELAAAALALEPGELGGPVAVTGDLVLFAVTARERFDPERFAAERDATREELEQQRFGLVLGSLIERRRAELEVSFDPTFLENFGTPLGT